MSEFIDKRGIFEKGWRGTYLIIPLKVKDGSSFQPGNFSEISFNSNVDEFFDKSEILKKRCTAGYVKKFELLTRDDIQIKIKKNEKDEKNEIVFSIQNIYYFENDIAFLTLLNICKNSEINTIYTLVNNGYIGADGDPSAYTDLYNKIEEVIKDTNLEIFVDDPELLLNESYVQNVAFVADRFNELETLEQVTFNMHKQISLEQTFEDKSEKDIYYTYGARDVKEGTYRWGCCISSLNISYVYQSDKVDNEHNVSEAMISTSAGDLLLTILVLAQKYTCMKLNNDIHKEIYGESDESQNEDTNNQKQMKPNFITKRQSIKKLKRSAIEFRAFGTLTPSQVSRWHNVCETYRGLVDTLGVNEALAEIEQKLDLINSEQEKYRNETQNIISVVITVFGFVSIIASVLAIVDLILKGEQAITISFFISTIMLIVFGYWIILSIRK